MKRFPQIMKKVIIWVVVIAIIAVGASFAIRYFGKSKAAVNAKDTITTASVETRDIQNVLSSSGTIQPLNSYNVTTLVEGDVIAANFEEGDTVQKGQVLYQISTDTLDSQIETQQTNVTRAQEDYAKAKKSYEDALESYDKAQVDYNKALEKYNTTQIKAEDTGVVNKVYVKVGDTLQKGSQIADIYDNSKMLLVVPFNASDVDQSTVGDQAEVVIDDSFESIEGKVTAVSKIEETLSGNRLVKKVTIEVKNPGGLTEQTKANAVIDNDITSADAGTFSVKTNKTITSELSGEIVYLGIMEDSEIKAGEVIIKISQDSIDSQLESYKNAVENAQTSIDNAKQTMEDKQESIDDAKKSLQDVIDGRTDYSITSPVTGRVITKNALAGDTISKNGSALCVIYDLSAATFDMNVDELDIREVKEGQEVNITADALEGVEFSGVVTNISLASTTNSGVTEYPVTVRIDKFGDLLPGMNVTGEIVVKKVEGVLAVPNDALMRGDMVYVKDDSVTEAAGEVPAGFKAVQVTTGITDGDYTEISNGLTGTEEVYVKRTTDSGSMMNNMFFPGGMQGGGFGGNGGNRSFGGSGGFGGNGGFGGGNGGGFPGN